MRVSMKSSREQELLRNEDAIDGMLGVAVRALARSQEAVVTPASGDFFVCPRRTPSARL
jgi:hypothetical protein